MSLIRKTAREVARRHISFDGCAQADLADSIHKALRDERERALTDAARQECVFCAGEAGFNSTPVEAALPAETDAGNYVHRNDPPHGLAGVYCKAPRIRALMSKED